jgi:hypothetical protein
MMIIIERKRKLNSLLRKDQTLDIIIHVSFDAPQSNETKHLFIFKNIISNYRMVTRRPFRVAARHITLKSTLSSLPIR